MRYEFHPEARVEYLKAVAYYDERQAGLGTRFTVEIERTIQRIVEVPHRWRNLEGEIRRCLARTLISPAPVSRMEIRPLCSVASRTVPELTQMIRHSSTFPALPGTDELP